MKIIKEGKIPESPSTTKPIYQIECEKCKTIFQFIADEALYMSSERRPDGFTTVSVECPLCCCLVQHKFKKSHYTVPVIYLDETTLISGVPVSN